MQQYAAQPDHDTGQVVADGLAGTGRAAPIPIVDFHVVPDGAGPECPEILRAENDRLRAELVAAHTKIENLELALRSSRQIGAAVGVVMNQLRLTQDAAFDVLVAASQQSHRKLRDIAAEVVYTGTLDGAGQKPRQPARPHPVEVSAAR